MADSLSIREKIARSLATAIASVTVANGYEVSLSSVTRPGRISIAGLAHLAALLVQTEDGREEGVDNTTQEGWVQSFAVYVKVAPSESDATPVDTYVNAADAAIRKAVMADRQRTYGGAAQAYDTRIQPSDFVIAEGGDTVLIVNVDVHYKTDELDPYSK